MVSEIGRYSIHGLSWNLGTLTVRIIPKMAFKLSGCRIGYVGNQQGMLYLLNTQLPTGYK